MELSLKQAPWGHPSARNGAHVMGYLSERKSPTLAQRFEGSLNMRSDVMALMESAGPWQ